MKISIQNEKMKVEIDTYGAELSSIKSGDGLEYLWQGDPRYWKGRAYNLFPIVGRLYEATYTWQGAEYRMDCHGFAHKKEYAVTKKTDTSATFSLKNDAETAKQYPFRFRFDVTYSLRGSTLSVKYTVKNPKNAKGELPFSVGGHPGFNVPLGDKSDFSASFLQFPRGAKPVQVFMSDEHVLVTGVEKPYPLKGGKILLRHDLFDHDAIVLKNSGGKVTLKTLSGRGVTVEYPGMDYVGFWHKNETDAPYVCVEPWASLPSFEGKTDDFATKAGFTHLLPGETYRNGFRVKIF